MSEIKRRAGNGTGTGATSSSRVVLVGTVPDDPVVHEVFERFATEDREPIALYRALAHAPAILRAYGALATGLRYEGDVAPDLRELVIMRIAQLTGSRYEWAHHRLIATQVGLTDEQLVEMHSWSSSRLFDERQRLTLRLVDGVHGVALNGDAFEAVRASLGEAQAVELVVIAAFYEAVARIVQGLGLEVEPEYAANLDLAGGGTVT